MQVSRKRKLFVPLLLSIFLLLCALFAACNSSDLGTCTIMTTGDDVVYQDMSLEDCQIQFGETVGANGWEWEAN